MLTKPKNIPKKPGVYIFKNKDETIIYIGKAKSLFSRIASYFNNPDVHKVAMILQEATSLETIPVNSELEALYLEVELIKKYQPKFNTLLKEGNPFIYIHFSHAQLPAISVVRTKQKPGTYIGPFLTKKIAHSVFNFLIKTFQLKLCKKTISSGCLQYHIGICAGSCSAQFDVDYYITRFKLAQYLATKNPQTAIKHIDEEIKQATNLLQYEKAQQLHEYKKNFQQFADILDKLATMPSKQEKISSQKNLQILLALQKRLHLEHIPYVIDCFDISHLQGTYIVGSCIRYVNAEPETKAFRRFQIKTLDNQNDFAALQEIVQRRYKNETNYPNLIIVDGGKGQISAIKPFVGPCELVGLAKKEETIISSDFKSYIKLDQQRPEDLLILQIRDKTHNFAISYHRKKRSESLRIK